jgi:hypothetical protein
LIGERYLWQPAGWRQAGRSIVVAGEACRGELAGGRASRSLLHGWLQRIGKVVAAASKEETEPQNTQNTQNTQIDCDYASYVTGALLFVDGGMTAT